MFILQVIPISKSVRVKTLSYFSVLDVKLGSLVTVPLRKKEVRALVISSELVVNLKTFVRSSEYQLRNILEVHEKKFFSEAFLRTISDMSHYYVSYPGLILDTLIPKVVLNNIQEFPTITERRDVVKNSEVLLLQSNKSDRLASYKAKAREFLTQNKSLYIICPTIDIATEVFESVQKGIENRCVLIHGSLSAKKMELSCKKIQESKQANIVVGTSLCLCLNAYNTGSYIIESCSSPYYHREIASPYMDMKMPIIRCAYHSGVPCIMADTILDSELWKHYNDKSYLTMQTPTMKIIDYNKTSIVSYNQNAEKQSEAQRIKELRHTKAGFHPLHTKSMSAISEGIKSKKNIFIYVPKKGIAPNIICGDCGNIATSKESGHPYTLYSQENNGKKEYIYICNATGKRVPAFDLCQICNSHKLKKMGLSTQGIADILIETFPKEKIIVLDKHNVKTKKALKEIQKEYSESSGLIVVGTQMAIDCLPSWDLGIITTVAPILSSVNYKNEENVLMLIGSIQEKTNEKLIIQDRKDIASNLPILVSGIHSDFIETELAVRKEYNFPPYSTLFKLRIIVPKKDLKKNYQYYEQRFEKFNSSMMVKPHSAKEVLIVVLIRLPRDKWTFESQDSQLTEQLSHLERNVALFINPNSLS